MIEGGTKMPSAPEVVMTPAPKRRGKPCSTIAGRMMEPIATTVATLDPAIAAKSAQATTPASPSPPAQCPTSDVVNAIIRRATPPCVKKLPARMKNGIAMIWKFSMPVKSFNATLSMLTWVMVKMKVSTVSPSEIEIGMPVSMRAKRRAKMKMAFIWDRPSPRPPPPRSLPHGCGCATAIRLSKRSARPPAGSGST
jgi:hypothetical protein